MVLLSPYSRIRGRRMWRLGYGGSIALPFLLPLVAFVALLAADRSY